MKQQKIYIKHIRMCIQWDNKRRENSKQEYEH
jgi:hypothetical protein